MLKPGRLRGKIFSVFRDMNTQNTKTAPAVYTIGHSTHPIEKFIEMLKAHDIELLADVRTIPKSRHNPQYGSNTLAAGLKDHQIAYVHLAGLGGLRHAKKDSVNLGWENASFRGFADYMETEGFEKGLSELMEIAGKQRTAILCAEALPWRCHRSLIADALLVRGIEVKHIMSKTSAKEHVLTPWAVVSGVMITYPKPRAT
jgi:uncharacterized protein (DUF488 family)